MSDTYSHGNVPFWTNPVRVLEAKILNSLNAGGGGGGGAVLKGTGNPNGAVTSTVAGALFYDPVAGSLWEFNGVANTNTGWIQIV